MNKFLTVWLVAVCMFLSVPAHAGMQEMHPHSLAAAWQIVKKQMSADGQTLFVQDRAAALDLLNRLGVSMVPEEGVRLEKDGCIIVIRPGGKDSSIFYKLNVSEKDKPEYTVMLKKRD